MQDMENGVNIHNSIGINYCIVLRVQIKANKHSPKSLRYHCIPAHCLEQKQQDPHKSHQR